MWRLRRGAALACAFTGAALAQSNESACAPRRKRATTQCSAPAVAPEAPPTATACDAPAIAAAACMGFAAGVMRESYTSNAGATVMPEARNIFLEREQPVAPSPASHVEDEQDEDCSRARQTVKRVPFTMDIFTKDMNTRHVTLGRGTVVKPRAIPTRRFSSNGLGVRRQAGASVSGWRC